MGRKKFEIRTDIDSVNLSIYLQKWQKKIINEYCEDEKNTEKECEKFSDLVDILCIQANEGHPPSDISWLQTHMLYCVSNHRRDKIRSTLRAKRNKKNNKRQLTIHDDVYVKLKQYSEHQNMTLSDAIKSLLLLKGN